MAFGLVGLLVTIGVIAWLMHAIYLPDVNASLQAERHVEPEIRQWSGEDANGMAIENTYSDFPDMRSDGKLEDLQITQIRPGSPLDVKYGLKAKDVVIAAYGQGGYRTELNGLDNEQAGKDAIRGAFTYDGQLVVLRGDVQLTLPVPKSQAKPPPPPANTTAQNQQMQQNAQRTEQQQEHGKSGNGDENGTMDEIRQRMHALPTY
jgi:hypothetical protein